MPGDFEPVDVDGFPNSKKRMFLFKIPKTMDPNLLHGAHFDLKTQELAKTANIKCDIKLDTSDIFMPIRPVIQNEDCTATKVGPKFAGVFTLTTKVDDNLSRKCELLNDANLVVHAYQKIDQIRMKKNPRVQIVDGREKSQKQSKKGKTTKKRKKE